MTEKPRQPRLSVLFNRKKRQEPRQQEQDELRRREEEARQRQLAADEALAREIYEQELAAVAQPNAAQNQAAADGQEPATPPAQPRHDPTGFLHLPRWFWLEMVPTLVITALLALWRPAQKLAVASRMLHPLLTGNGDGSPGLLTLVLGRPRSVWGTNATAAMDTSVLPLLLEATWPPRLAQRISPLRAGVTSMNGWLAPGSFAREFWWLLAIGIPVIAVSLISALRKLPPVRAFIQWVVRYHKQLRASVWALGAVACAVESSAILLQRVPTVAPGKEREDIGFGLELSFAHSAPFSYAQPWYLATLHWWRA